MEDVITEEPPPSRFLEEELNNFTSPSPPFPPPSLSFSNPHLQETTLQPSLLIILLSPPSLYLFHSLPPNSLIATLTLTDTTCNIINIYSIDSHDAIVVSVNCSVPPERSHSIAKLLIGDRISPKRVLILDSIRFRNYRGRLSPDEAVAFKLETLAERKIGVGERILKGLEYYPSGSVVDGLGAAILGKCQVLNIRGVLCVSWPEFDASVVSLVKGLVQRDVLPGFDLNLSDAKGDKLPLKFGPSKDRPFQFDFYA